MFALLSNAPAATLPPLPATATADHDVPTPVGVQLIPPSYEIATRPEGLLAVAAIREPSEDTDTRVHFVFVPAGPTVFGVHVTPELVEIQILPGFSVAMSFEPSELEATEDH